MHNPAPARPMPVPQRPPLAHRGTIPSLPAKGKTIAASSPVRVGTPGATREGSARLALRILDETLFDYLTSHCPETLGEQDEWLYNLFLWIYRSVNRIGQSERKGGPERAALERRVLLNALCVRETAAIARNKKGADSSIRRDWSHPNTLPEDMPIMIRRYSEAKEAVNKIYSERYPSFRSKLCMKYYTESKQKLEKYRQTADPMEGMFHPV